LELAEIPLSMSRRHVVRTKTNLTHEKPPINLPDIPTKIAILRSELKKTKSHGATTPWLSSF